MDHAEVTEPAVTVSVVMATYNREHYIREALDSLLDQTRPPDEVIVVDDGSTDQTGQVVAEYGERVRYVHKANGGMASALNVGIAQASGSHIWIFDDDDVALPRGLEASLAALELHPEADFAYSHKLFCDGDGDIWDRSRWRKHRIQHSDPDQLFVQLMQWGFCPIQGMVIPERCFEALGPFDEKLIRAQDYDMILRLARRFRGVEIGCFMLVMRNHSGDRGPAFERHRNVDRMRYWRRYDKMTFSRLHRDIALHEYLPGRASGALSQADLRAALLMRADVMYHHGVYAKGSRDLRQAVAAGAGGAQVEALIRQATNVNESAFVPGLTHISVALIRLSGHKQSRQWHTSALRGFYWTLRRMLGQRQLVASVVLFNAMALLIGAQPWRWLQPLRDKRAYTARQ